MNREKIYNVLMDNYSETIRALREIYKLHLEDKIEIYKQQIKDCQFLDSPHVLLVIHANEKIKELEQELKTLEGE